VAFLVCLLTEPQTRESAGQSFNASGREGSGQRRIAEQGGTEGGCTLERCRNEDGDYKRTSWYILRRVHRVQESGGGKKEQPEGYT